MRLLSVLVFSLWAGSACLAQSRFEDFSTFSCDELWQTRNEIYKEAGYCFKTAKAIRRFGNSGCSYDDMEDVPLSRSKRQLVAEIQRWERAHRCPR